MRLLLLSDTHGKLSIINELAATVQADAVVHAGDFGFYGMASGGRLSERELRILVRHSSVNQAEKKRAKGMSKDDLAVFVQKHKLLGDLQRYIKGEASFNVPVYAVWGNHEDKHVIEAFRDESYQVPNLHLLDERHVYHVGPFTLFGLGGNVLTGKKLFHDPIGGGGKVWATLGQFGKLCQTLSEVPEDDEEVRVFVTHVSPGKEPLAALMGAQYRADFHVSGHMAPPHTMIWNNFAIRKLERAKSWLIDGVAHIRENWELQKSYLKRRSTFESIEFGIGLLELSEMKRVRLGGRSVPAWYLTDYINLPDAHCGYALLEASQGKVDMLSRSTHSSL